MSEWIEKVTITKDEYFYLRKCAMELQLLEWGGVDNWEWYGPSLNPVDEDSLETKQEKLFKEIEEM